MLVGRTTKAESKKSNRRNLQFAGGDGDSWGDMLFLFLDRQQNLWVKTGLVSSVEVRFLRHDRANE
jgi:hypothetical protein